MSENNKNREVEIRSASLKSKKFIVWDIKSDQMFANEKFISIEETKDFIIQNKMFLVNKIKLS